MRVLDLSTIAGVCGDLTPVIEAATESMEPGEIVVIRINKELVSEVEDALKTLSDRLEVVERVEKNGEVEFKVKVKE